MAGSKNKRLPSFRSVDAFVAFFESHDMGDYWDQLPKAEIKVNVTKRVRARNSSAPNQFRSNTGKPWTPTQVKQLRQLASQAIPTRVIGLKLGRSENAVRTKASQKGVSLRRTSRAPYRQAKK